MVLLTSSFAHWNKTGITGNRRFTAFDAMSIYSGGRGTCYLSRRVANATGLAVKGVCAKKSTYIVAL